MTQHIYLPYKMSCSVGVLRFELHGSLSLIQNSGNVTKGDVYLLIEIERTQGYLATHVLPHQSDNLHRGHQIPKAVRSEDLKSIKIINFNFHKPILLFFVCSKNRNK